MVKSKNKDDYKFKNLIKSHTFINYYQKHNDTWNHMIPRKTIEKLIGSYV
ncbi:MAG: hypothetical protein ACFFHD_11490 [Promethearchaeota archaeon]